MPCRHGVTAGAWGFDTSDGFLQDKQLRLEQGRVRSLGPGTDQAGPGCGCGEQRGTSKTDLMGETHLQAQETDKNTSSFASFCPCGLIISDTKVETVLIYNNALIFKPSLLVKNSPPPQGGWTLKSLQQGQASVCPPPEPVKWGPRVHSWTPGWALGSAPPPRRWMWAVESMGPTQAGAGGADAPLRPQCPADSSPGSAGVARGAVLPKGFPQSVNPAPALMAPRPAPTAPHTRRGLLFTHPSPPPPGQPVVLGQK